MDSYKPINIKKLILGLALFLSGVLQASTQPPVDSLIAKYPFNQTFNDETGNGNNGISTGAVFDTNRFFQANRAITLDGIDDCVKIGTMDSLTASLNRFSISFWLKSDSVQPNKTIIGNSNDEGAGMHFGIGIKSDTSFVFKIRANDGKSLRFLSDFNMVFDNEWHHIVIAVDNSKDNELTFYLDNAEMDIIITDSMSPENFVNFTYPFTLGAWNNRGTIEQYFKGYLDDIRFYGKSLDSIEIHNLYHERYCKQTIYDSITITDTNFITEYITIYDTISITDTNFITEYITIHDTISITDTNFITEYITIYDTINIIDTTFIIENITEYDTVSVTDTLIIEIDLTNNPQQNDVVLCKIYPNPTNDVIYVHIAEYERMTGYGIRIINSLSVVVYDSLIENRNTEININSLGKEGLYFIQIVNKNSDVIETKKLLLN